MSLQPIVDIEKWAKAYKIQMEKIECPECKEKFRPDQALVIPGYRGVMLSDHGCGEQMPFRVVPYSEDKVAFWEQLRPNADS